MDPSFLKRRMWEDWRPKTRRSFPEVFPDRARSLMQRSPRSSASNRREWGRPRNPNPRVRIPVKFQDSCRPEKFREGKKNSCRRAQMSEDTAAVKIQAAFRGFFIRKDEPLKNLKAIAMLKLSMEEIRQRINNENVVELMWRNEKERLKITEGLMSLLLKLDAVQGANTFVRESRKSVIRELVKLQEIVDAIIVDKPEETEATTTDNAEESAILEISAVSSDAQVTSLENEIMLCDNENEHAKVVANENTEPDKEDPEKQELVSRNGSKDSSNPSKESSESLKDAWDNISVVDVKQIPEPVKDAVHDIPVYEMQENPDPTEEFSHDVPMDDVPENPEPENDPFSDDMEDNAKVEGKFGEEEKIVCKDSSEPIKDSFNDASVTDFAVNVPQIIAEDPPCMDDGIFSEKDLRSASNEEIHLDQIRSWIAEGRDDIAIIDAQDERDRNTYTKPEDEEFDAEKSGMIKASAGSERMKKVIEDLHHRNELQNDIIENIQKKLEKMERRILHFHNTTTENPAYSKRKRSTPDDIL